MKRSEEEKLTDILMGEAVIALLKMGKRISSRSLLSQLHLIQENEIQPRRQACSRAIAEVERNMAPTSLRTTVTVRDGENVSHFFTSDGPTDNVKKH